MRPEKTEKKKRRVEIVDLMKCLTIFAVVWGHTALNEELTGNPPMLYKILYSFHMPLFFFLAGLSSSLKPLKTRQEWKIFFRKNILALAFPYLVWALIFCNFNFQNVGYILYGSWQALGKTGTLTSLWYLPSFFAARVYVQLIVNLFASFQAEGKRLLYLVPSFIFLIISLILPKLSMGYPWCMDNAFAGAGFILMGIALKETLIRFSVQKESVLAGTLLGAAGLYVVTVFLLGDHFIINMMCKSSYGMPVPALLLAILGGTVVAAAAMLLKRLADEWIPNFSTRSMTYIGQHTMGIFLLHKPMMQQLIIPELRSLLGGVCPEALIRLMGACIAFTAAILLCRIIEHYVPEMLGIFRKELVTGTEAPE